VRRTACRVEEAGIVKRQIAWLQGASKQRAACSRSIQIEFDPQRDLPLSILIESAFSGQTDQPIN
jgi:hypothetical protein